MAILKKATVWTGNTYPIRDAIKSLGGRWDAASKSWIVPPLTMAERSAVYAMCGGLRGVNVVRA